MPHRLRDSVGHGIWGIDGLTGKDAELVRVGNIIIRRVCKLIKSLISQNKAGYLEQSQNSIAWKVIDILLRKEILQGSIAFHDFDMCQYGTSWRKRTRVMRFGPHRDCVHLRFCSSKNGICSRTHLPHEILEGTVNGVWKTSIAQVYPYAFVRSLLSELCDV